MPIGESTKTGMGKISDFQYKDYDVLVISYDQLKKYADTLKSVTNIGL